MRRSDDDRVPVPSPSTAASDEICRLTRARAAIGQCSLNLHDGLHRSRSDQDPLAQRYFSTFKRLGPNTINDLDDRITKAQPASWRDRLTDRASLMRQVETTVEHCIRTLNFVEVFLKVLPSKSVKDRFTQLQHAVDRNRDWMDEVVANIALQMSEVFLVTGATDLDQLDSKIRESRAKLQAYKKVVGDCPTVAKLNFPPLDDEYESPIGNLEMEASLFRSHECKLGKPAMDAIVAIARTETQNDLPLRISSRWS
jgi:hypothetical protein